MKDHKKSSEQPKDTHAFETKESVKLQIEQAKRLKPLVREHGLKVSVFLPTTLGTWILEMVEEGRFHDPSEAVFVMMGLAKNLDPHQDLKDEILNRELDARFKNRDKTKYYSMEEVKAHMEALKEKLKNRPEPPVWEKIIVE